MARRFPRSTHLPVFRLPTTPRIVLFSRAKTPLDPPLGRLIAALRKFLRDEFVPVWGTPAILTRGRGFVRGAWAIGIFETSRDASLDGFHDLTPDGLPFARVYQRNIRRDQSTLGECVSHELAEMLIDPTVNLGAEKSDRVFYDCEVADPVEETPFLVNGVPMTNFVYPAWFEAWRDAGSTQFDHGGKLQRPFQILRTGYARQFRGGKWKEVGSSHQKAARFEADDRASHRRGLRSGRPRKLSQPRPGRAG